MRIDLLLLTASNEGQAEAYRTQLRARGMTPESGAVVIADPGGRRVGSGISTIDALAHAAGTFAGAPGARDGLSERFTRRNVVIVHCGGDSRRLPAAAADGKIFAPLPVEGRAEFPPALFDLILEDLRALTVPAEGRVIVATGDVFLDVARHRPRFDRPGFTGVAWASTPARGSRHGVYICGGRGEVTGFVHKPSAREAADAGAIRDDGTVLVDTGLLSLEPRAAAHWLAGAGVGPGGALGAGLLAQARAGGGPAIDLYGDVLAAMARREQLHGLDWRGDFPFSAAEVPDCAFLHIGTTREMLDAFAGEAPAHPRFRPIVRARVPGGSPPGRVCIHNSVLERAPRTLGSRVVIEGSHLARAPSLPGSNLVVGVPRAVDDALDLPEAWGLVCLPLVGGEWTAVAFGDLDDFKTPLERGGTLGNRPLRDVLVRAGLAPEDLWPDGTEERALWTARLWAEADVGEVLRPLGWMLRREPPDRAWLARPRLSAAEVMARVDHGRLLEERGKVLARV